jgi:hypothetical protein
MQGSFQNVWAALRTGEARFGLRLTLSLMATAAVMGVSQLVIWLVLLARGLRARDDYLVYGFLLGLLPWYLLMRTIWRSGVGQYHPFARPVLVTLGVAAGTIFGMTVIAEEVRYGEDFLLLALGLLGLAGISSAWLPAIAAAQPRGPLFDEHGQVIVRCPQCGYSLVGMHELRCPECGMHDTLDAVIRAQIPYWSGTVKAKTTKAESHEEEPRDSVAAPGQLR